MDGRPNRRNKAIRFQISLLVQENLLILHAIHSSQIKSTKYFNRFLWSTSN